MELLIAPETEQRKLTNCIDYDSSVFVACNADLKLWPLNNIDFV